MIVGLGSDIIEIGRIRASLERFGDKFLARAFTRAEAGFCLGRSDPAASLAVRFAAKEAVAKALGTGLAQGIRLRDIEIVGKPNGAPAVLLHGAAAQLAESRGIGHWLISLSHSADLAQAVAIALAQ